MSQNWPNFLEDLVRLPPPYNTSGWTCYTTRSGWRAFSREGPEKNTMRTTNHKNLGSGYARSPAGHLFYRYGVRVGPLVFLARARARVFDAERLARLPRSYRTRIVSTVSPLTSTSLVHCPFDRT